VVEVTVMPTLTLTDDQVVELVDQLPLDRKQSLYHRLLGQEGDTWDDIARYGEERARVTAASRGRDWDAMSEDERDAFVDELMHEP
jgi:hypothetical protein